MKFKYLMLICLPFLSCGFSEEQKSYFQGDKYQNDYVSFAVTKPEGWYFSEIEEVLKNKGDALKETTEENKQREQNLRDLERLTKMEPLTIQKFKEPYEKPNPSFEFYYFPLERDGAITSLSLLKDYMVFYSQKMHDFKNLESPKPAPLSGLEAAHSKYQFTLYSEDKKPFKIISNLWIVRREGYYFQIMSFCSTFQCGEVKEEFRKIFDSISIQH